MNKSFRGILLMAAFFVGQFHENHGCLVGLDKTTTTEKPEPTAEQKFMECIDFYRGNILYFGRKGRGE